MPNQSNQEIVEKFFSSYQQHDYQGMWDCLEGDVKFSDYAFDITGKEVKAMWRWFCEKPVKVPEYRVLSSTNDTVLARYRVDYLYGDKQRPVDYWIRTSLKIRDGKIAEQLDTFSDISETEFAKMAFGSPLQWLAGTPLLRPTVRAVAKGKLRQFMREHGT